MACAGKLGLDASQIARCRSLAADITGALVPEIACRSTVSIERTILRLWEVNSTAAGTEVPLANAVVDSLRRSGRLEQGVAMPLAALCVASGKSPLAVSEMLIEGSLQWAQADKVDAAEAHRAAGEFTGRALSQIAGSRAERQQFADSLEPPPNPWLYVIVATGDIYEDMKQAVSAAHAGADCIAVIRSTAQSLLDYVPEGATTEGFGGTYATGENFRLMREQLDDVSRTEGRYIRLVNYASGLCMPEISILAAEMGLDMLLNDSMYGIIFRDIHRMRTLVDQMLSRRICAKFGIIINTGEDNYLTTADATEAAHTVLASQFINESFAACADMPPGLMGLGHAFEVDPWLDNSLIYELATAQMTRDIFPEVPVKYMPPTRHKSGDIFFSHVQDALFNLTSCATGQSIHLCGMPTEAVHTPYVADRFMAVESARYVRNASRSLAGEISFSPDGQVAGRAKAVLAAAEKLLSEISQKGLLRAMADGVFADTRRPTDAGRGGDGVFVRAAEYFDPLSERLVPDAG